MRRRSRRFAFSSNSSRSSSDPRWTRLVFAFGCTAAIGLMLAYVASLEKPASDGVNIDEALLALWLGVSIVLLVVEVARVDLRLARFHPARSATSRV